MRRISRILFIVLTFQAALANTASATGKKYFDMPVTEWLRLSEGEKVESARELLSLHNENVSREQTESVTSCMNVIGKSPVWESSTVGTLLTKCAFDMGVAKSAREADWDALVACVKQEVPDFSKDELFSLGLSAAGASLAKDADSAPLMTPRTKRILVIMEACGKK